MNLGFDAKRYFHNPTGLGNYSRTLVNGLAALYPQHQYFLFNPKPTQRFAMPPNMPLVEVMPRGWFNRTFSSYWRSRGIVADIEKRNIALYHGLSHEIPVGLDETGIKSIVTVHDLIFERYPHQYGKYEVLVHRRKIQHACRHANAVIAISEQTKKDLVELYRVPAQKIAVCYQSCDPIFAAVAPVEQKEAVRKAYGLPQDFFLYVGSIIERKNLLRICMAMKETGDDFRLPLVVVGTGKKYAQQVKNYLQKAGLADRVLFTSTMQPASKEADLKHTSNLATLYQMATGFIYPSLFEGFGIPVLEAMWSGAPVITSNTSCLPETAGNAALLVDPLNVSDMAAAMVRLQNDAALRQTLVAKGKSQAQQFSLEQCTRSVMNVYEQIITHGSL
ncbi:glycosyltransferase family 4 protein [Pseudocnuella soli]|uniref:glycosyltransferase family 4 protein n=1 Tax=Pseudocnuella soli TaxID=2502779 RepID=UPI00104561DE|nr:glycosyltransferase family 1 protein [Pseudocnuella soli]